MTGEILLELVDDDGATTGVAEKLAAHLAPGQLHRAFSVFLFDDDGRMLLQRRALSKYHWPGVWSNACCGHPYPGEPPFLAATRRVVEELGVAPSSLRSAGTVTYRHVDEVSGLVEHEYNHLFVGRITTELAPDPAEVDDTAFVDAAELESRRANAEFSGWFGTVLGAASTAFTGPVGEWSVRDA
jgi:isopentenyl-diphosphate Delta-isomerase